MKCLRGALILLAFFSADLVAQSFSSLSTRLPVDERSAPSLTTVISSEEIKEMGAKDLAEVLSKVVGLHVGTRSQHYTKTFFIRGIVSEYSSQTLFLINGKPVNSSVRGNFQMIWGAYPLSAVEKIEILRGPGSSLYGANALSGVVNIVMKSYGSTSGDGVGYGLGQNNELNLWFDKQFQLCDSNIYLSYEKLQSDGVETYVRRDFQTELDERFTAMYESGLLSFEPKAISNAPYNISNTFQVENVWLSVDNHFMTSEFGWQERGDIGQGMGALDAIDPIGKLAANRVYLNIDTKPIALNNGLSVKGSLTHIEEKQRIEGVVRMLPIGANLGAFPEGVLAKPEFDESRNIAEMQIFYNQQDISSVVGLGYQSESVDDVSELKNFDKNLEPLPSGLTDVSELDDLVNMPLASRHIFYGYFETTHSLNSDLDITGGGRYDSYSDFGSVFSPKLSVVWMPTFAATFKMSYGQAYRAPSFMELYSTNNPVVNGNPELKPERIKGLDLSFQYFFSRRSSFQANVFYYEAHDVLESVTMDELPSRSLVKNVGKYTGVGYEFELSHQFNPTLNIKFSLNFIDTQSRYFELNSTKLGMTPAAQSFASLTKNLGSHWQFTAMAEYIGDRQYKTKVGQVELDDFVVFDGIIRYLYSHGAVELIMKNINNASASIGTNITESYSSDKIQTINTNGRHFSLRFSFQF